MRRKDREVTDEKIISQIFRDCRYVNLGFVDGDGYAYILPLNYGYEEKDGVRTLYFHSAKSGKKIDLINGRGKCSFELVNGEKVYGDGVSGCSYASAFKCIMGHGEIEFISDRRETVHALDLLMSHYEPGKKFDYKPEMLKVICVYKMTVKDLTCKVHE